MSAAVVVGSEHRERRIIMDQLLYQQGFLPHRTEASAILPAQMVR
jgi:hypothetical protein